MKLLPIDDAATEAKVPRRTIFHWISRGRLDAVKVPRDRRTYVSLDAVTQLRAEPVPNGRPRKRA